MKSSLMLAAFTLPLASLVLADELETQLDPVIVTATRMSEPKSQTLASVTVIERTEIERRQAHSVPDLLRGVAGVSIAQNGGEGHAASLFLRGTNSDHVLILIDGVKTGSVTLGTTPLENLPLDQIERIEIVRGPRSSLYGSEAIGGVIQIFTKQGGGTLTPRASIGGGTLGTGHLSGGLSGGGDQGWFNLGVNLDRTDGINACHGSVSPFAGCGVIEPDRDGYRNLGISARAGYAFSEAAKIDLHLLSSENRSDFDGSLFSGNVARSEQQVFGGTATFKPLEPWTLILSAGRGWDSYRTFYDDAAQLIDERFIDRFETTRDTLSLQNNVTLMPGQVATLGLDYLNDRVAGTVAYTEDSRDNLGVFGEYQGRFGATDLTLSLRQDDNQQFGEHVTGNTAIGYRFENSVQVSLSYGTAFKSPSFNDLYYPNYGNPELDPEQSRSLELGLSGNLPIGNDSGRWGINAYQTDIDDLITFDAVTFSAANINSARIRGVEATASARLFDWDVATSLTLINPENRTAGADQGKLLARRPEQSFQLDLDRQLDRWSVGATLFVAGRRFDDAANTVRLDGYTLVDLRTEYTITPALRLQARLENVLDETYETAAWFNQPGRAAYLTLRYEP